jgi:uncharacterized protein (TIGR03437 family)
MRASFTIVILTTATCLHAITPPVAFEKNEGQARREVAFLARVGGSRLFLVREGAEIAGIHLHLLGATPVDPVGRQLLAAKSNYLTGADRSQWRTGIANYQEVWYPRVYRGIDVRWHAQAGEIEQDFELAPGADPRRIRIAITGAPPAISAAGDLEAGNFRLRRPRAYQDGREIACRFVLRGGTAAFVVGAYNRRRPLTIDPVVVFSTLLGGASSSFSQARSVAVDSSGNIYVAGTTDAADFPVTASAYQTNYNNTQCTTPVGMTQCDDLFVSKFSGDGSTLLYSTYLGQAGYSALVGMAIDAPGNVYLAGTVNLPNVSHVSGFPSLASDPVVVKLSADGSSLLYATTVPLGASATVYALAADSAGAVYLTGYAAYNSPSLPLVNAFQSAINQPRVFKTTNSAQTWQGLANGLAGVLADSIAVDPENPQTVYLGLDEDLYKSADGGSHWAAILQALPAGAPYPEIDLLPDSIAIDPTNSQILYLGTAVNGIYKSTDGGNTWNSAWSGASRLVRMLAIDPANTKILYAANDDGVYKSTDGAATWNATSLITAANYTFFANSVVIDPSAPSTVYAGTENGVYKSTDAGATWTAMTTGFTDSTEITNLAIDPTNPQVLYASTTINFAPYRTTDGGAHWTQGTWAPEQGLLPYVNALLVDPLVHTTVWAVTDYSLRVSRDSGATWSAPPTDLPGYNVQALASGTDGSIYAIANDFDSDAFALKLDPNGSQIDYCTYLGGSGPDAGNSIAVDGAGRAYIAGYTNSFDFPVANALQPRIGGLQDGFLTVLDPTGAKLSWSTYIGGSGDDSVLAVAVDGAGNVHLTGGTDSLDFPLQQAAQAQPAEIFAAKLRGDGSELIFSTYYGGSGYYSLPTVAADGSGNTYVGGNLAVDNPQQQNGFVAAWNGETGAPLYTTNLGGSKYDTLSGIAVDSAGNAYIVGSTNSPDFPRIYAYQYAFGAAYQDAFLAKIAPGTAGPSISLSGVTNAASYTSTVSPGEIVSLFGKQLAVTPATAAAAPFPLQLSDAHVTVNGTAAPLFYVSPLQINLQIPYETAAGSARIQVTSGSGAATLNVPVAPAAPAIFTLNSLGNGAGAIEHALTGQLVTSANPAAAGEVVAVYCTGLGAVSPPVADGAAAPVPPAQAVMPVTAFIADTPAPVIFAGLTPGFAGLYQVNVQIPAGTPSGVQNMAISVSGAASNTVTLAVH